LVNVYSKLEGFPKPEEQPEYYKLLRNVGDFAKMPAAEIYAAFSTEKKLLGAVVFFGDMHYYSSGGTANQEEDAAGFRLLAVNEYERGKGIGKKLTLKCIERAKELKVSQVIIHTTKAMKPAWEMYEKMGFRRSVDLDFAQGNLPVFGFRFILNPNYRLRRALCGSPYLSKLSVRK
jgi:GNAT superfamily N-acetyltransferase